MGLESFSLIKTPFSVRFAPCMGLERLIGNINFYWKRFAPCMGLESTLYYLFQEKTLFAPCMGLESV